MPELNEQIVAARTDSPRDPLFSKDPITAREDVINDAFEWGATNQVIGQQIWDRAREYEREVQSTICLKYLDGLNTLA